MSYVAIESPPTWQIAEVPPPKIAESAGAVLLEWTATASPNGDAALVSGCVATPIPGWVEDMEPAVQARTVALAGATAERITGSPVDARSDGRGGLVLRAASDLGGDAIGTAHTFLGFDRESRVLTCFAACASRRGARSTELECAQSVERASLQGVVPPPRPGLLLGSATWGVHHPRPAALGGFVVLLAAGILAVLTRRRTRSP